VAHLTAAIDLYIGLIDTDIADGRPLPRQPCVLDMPDDFFRIRLVCVLLDTCGMCFDRGAQKKKLDNFLTFFQVRPLRHCFQLDDDIFTVLCALQTRPSHGR
jgi:hypothetical protein